jgi:hypothetical protein
VVSGISASIPNAPGSRSCTFGFPNSVAARPTFEPVASAAVERRLGVVEIDQIGKPPMHEGVN